MLVSFPFRLQHFSKIFFYFEQVPHFAYKACKRTTFNEFDFSSMPTHITVTTKHNSMRDHSYRITLNHSYHSNRFCSFMMSWDRMDQGLANIDKFYKKKFVRFVSTEKSNVRLMWVEIFSGFLRGFSLRRIKQFVEALKAMFTKTFFLSLNRKYSKNPFILASPSLNKKNVAIFCKHPWVCTTENMFDYIVHH